MHDRRSNRRAFSIIELLTIVVILGVVAGVVLPRLVGNDRRAAQRELQQVEDLLTSAASREAFSSTPVALAFEDGTLRIRVLRSPEELTPWSGPGTWVDDPLARPVTLEHLRLASASASGQVLADDAWRVDMTTLEARPAVALGLTDSRGNDWVVHLASEAERATTSTLDAGTTSDGLAGQAVDLDEIGREEDPW